MSCRSTRSLGSWPPRSSAHEARRSQELPLCCAPANPVGLAGELAYNFAGMRRQSRLLCVPCFRGAVECRAIDAVEPRSSSPCMKVHRTACSSSARRFAPQSLLEQGGRGSPSSGCPTYERNDLRRGVVDARADERRVVHHARQVWLGMLSSVDEYTSPLGIPLVTRRGAMELARHAAGTRIAAQTAAVQAVARYDHLSHRGNSIGPRQGRA